MPYGTPAEKRGLTRRAWGSLSLSVVSCLGVALLPNVFGPIFFLRQGGEIFPYVFALAQLALWVFGCGSLARSKGYSAILGIAGTLGCAGLLVLLVLPDRWQRAWDGVPTVHPNGSNGSFDA